MEIVFIRHGKTRGNIEKRYIGVTDESLSAEGIAEIVKKVYPLAEQIVSSSMKRCIETAQLIYPNTDIIIDSRLNECNFGYFEGKNYDELNGIQNYQNWIDSNGEMPFPNGESMGQFKARCLAAFEAIIEKLSDKNNIAFVVHGGTIMAILEAFSDGKKGYYDFMCENANGFICLWEDRKCTNIRSLR